MNAVRQCFDFVRMGVRAALFVWSHPHQRRVVTWVQAREAGDQTRAARLWEELNAGANDEQKAELEKLRGLLEDTGTSPWLEAMGQAHECEKHFDWNGAKTAYQRATTVEANTGLESGAWRDLSALHSMLDENDLALQCAQKATQAARHAESAAVLAMALSREAALLIERDTDLTRERIAEVLALVEDAPTHDIVRTRALITRAQCATQENDLNGAERELSAVWKHIKSWRNEVFLADRRGVMVAYWTALAALSEKRGNWKTAQEARLEAVEHARFIASAPQLEGPFKHNTLAKALFRAGEALQHNHDSRANLLFKQSHQVRASIGLKPLDETR